MISSIFAEISLAAVSAIFFVGIVCMLVRRVAVWNLVGQIIAVKAVVAGSFFLARYLGNTSGDLLMLSLIFLGLLPLIGAVGLLVLHRCARFGGTLDLEDESRLKN